MHMIVVITTQHDRHWLDKLERPQTRSGDVYDWAHVRPQLQPGWDAL